MTVQCPTYVLNFSRRFQMILFTMTIMLLTIRLGFYITRITANYLITLFDYDSPCKLLDNHFGNGMLLQRKRKQALLYVYEQCTCLG